MEYFFTQTVNLKVGLLTHGHFAVLAELLGSVRHDTSRWHDPSEKKEVEFYDVSKAQRQIIKDFNPDEVEFFVEEDAYDFDDTDKHGRGKRQNNDLTPMRSYDAAFNRCASLFLDDRGYRMVAKYKDTEVLVRSANGQTVHEYR